MILSCPACLTRYRLADGAIPPEGRQVRCKKCGNSWNEPGEPMQAAEDVAPLPVIEGAAPPPPVEVAEPEIPFAQPPAFAPQIDTQREEEADDGIDPFVPAPPFQPKPRRGRWLIIVLLVLAALIATVALLRFYGPADIKARLGASTGGSVLVLELPREPERRTLSSGNELFALTGKVVNPTSSSQRVPDIVAELRDRQNNPVYRWTITPPKRTLGPKETVEFDAAEIDVPPGAQKVALSFSSRAIG